MKKIWLLLKFFEPKKRKIWCVMKLCIIFTLFFSFSASARVVAQQEKVNLNLSGATLQSLFQEIQKQTGLYFVYNDEQCNNLGEINIKIEAGTVEQVLEEVFQNKNFTYRLEGNIIVVKSGNHAVPQVVSRKITGKVKDHAGNALLGVSVVIEGTSIGVTTDVNGNYSLECPQAKNLVLKYSFMGMKPVKMTVGDKTVLNVVMEEDIQEIEEVVITGMFTRKAESFTGSAKTIKGEDLQRVGNGNVFQSLKNMDPSLNIMDNMEFGSDPNKLPTMHLRGTSTFPVEGNSDLRSNYQDDPNQPLFILDGFEVSAMRVFDMDMNRIQSLTILKDASAKAIYGSKAANGVVVIETKKPIAGEFRVTYKGSVDITMPDLTSYDLTNSLEKLKIERTAGLYESYYLSGYQSKMNDYNKRMKAALEGLNTDWLAKPLHTGVGTKHSVSFEMGDQKVNVIADFSFNNVIGVMRGSDRKVLSGNINVAYRLNNRFLFRNIMSITVSNSKDSPYGSFDEYAIMNPYYSPYDKAGNITPDNNNPLYNGTLNTKLTSGYLEFANNFYAEYNILNGLKAVGRIGITTQRSEGDRFYPGNHTKFADYPDEDLLRKGSYQQNNGKYNNLSGEFTLQYSKTLKKHFLLANFGFSVSEKQSAETVHYAEGFPSDRMDDITFALQYAKGKTPYGVESIVRDMGFVGVLGYTFDDRFLTDLTVRKNASSQFGVNNRWGTFWSAGIGWNVHNERWAMELDWLQQFKLRGSIGTTGSQAFSSYQSIATYKYYTDASYVGMLGAYMMRLANKDLKWQSKMDYNVGFDARLAGLTLSFDYYESITDNLITDLSLPTSVGHASVKENIGKVKNKGIDITASYRIFSNKDGFLNITASLTTNTNKIMKLSDAMRAYNGQQDALVSTKLNGGRSKPVLRYIEGGSLTSIWAVPSLGINPANGKEIYVQPDGTTTYSWKPEYQQIIGNSLEKVRGNFGFNGEYKGIGLGVIFRYLTGGQYYNQTLVDRVENADLEKNVDRRVLYGRWSETNKNAPFKSLSPYNDADGNYITAPKTEPTSRFVQDRNELTVSSINAYYDMRNRKWLNRAGFDRLKLAFNMNDVCTISSIKMERGTAYPFARTMSISLTAEF